MYHPTSDTSPMDCYLTATFLFVHYRYTLFGSLEVKEKKKLKCLVVKDVFKYNFQKEKIVFKRFLAEFPGLFGHLTERLIRL